MNWLILGDSSKTERLSENSLMVLKLLESDMYDFFFHRNVEPDRSGQWSAMESYIHRKYGALPEKALKKLFSDYKINDR